MSFFTDNMWGILVACIILLIMMKAKKKLSYFKDRGMPYILPTFKDFILTLNLAKVNDISEILYERCRDSDSPYVGVFFSFLLPSILVRDPKMVESVLIKDFSYFQDHGFDVDFESNPLAGNLFNRKGDEWRTLRHKLLPTFTSGKLKGMVPLMEECADKLVEEMKQDSSLRQDTNLKELFKKYSLSVIASCAFGIDPDSISDPNNEFRQILQDATSPPPFFFIILIFLIFFPSLAKRLNIKLVPQRIEDFIFKVTKETFEMRQKSGVKRNDFVQLLLELKEKGSVEINVKDLEQDEKDNISEMQSEPPSSKLEFTDELLSAQAFVFLVGGFENTAYMAAITAYLISKHPDIKSRVADEVNQVKHKSGRLDYQALRDMKLLTACIDEAMRLYPSFPALSRVCNKPYTFSDGKKIDKGASILIPTKALHYDTKYWTDPHRFNPDRFLSSENIRPGTYLPFGDGPRICIAQRMAMLMVKLLLVKLILNFDLKPSLKTKEPIKITVLVGADNEGGIWGCFEELNK